MNVRVVSAAVFALISSVSFQAHSSLVTNGSFESENGAFVGNVQNAMTLSVGSTTISGWTVFGDVIAWIKEPAFGLSAPDGQYFLDLTDYQLGSPFGGVRQTIATTAGTAYRVSFQLGSDRLYGLPSGLAVSAGSTSQTFSISAVGPDAWTTFSMDFVASGSSTVLSFLGNQGQNYIGLDNVSVNAIPTPGTFALVGLGLVGLGFARRRAV